MWDTPLVVYFIHFWYGFKFITEYLYAIVDFVRKIFNIFKISILRPKMLRPWKKYFFVFVAIPLTFYNGYFSTSFDGVVWSKLRCVTQEIEKNGCMSDLNKFHYLGNRRCYVLFMVSVWHCLAKRDKNHAQNLFLSCCILRIDLPKSGRNKIFACLWTWVKKNYSFGMGLAMIILSLLLL